MIATRRTEIAVTYAGKNISADIAPYMLDMRYTDHGTGKADELQISLQDRDGKWRSPWMPQAGDSIEAGIVLHHWTKPDSRQTVGFGSFEVDDLSYSGPPDTFQISATAFPLKSGLKNEAKTKAWEKVSLSQIVSRIAADAGMEAQFETFDVDYDRIDQTEQTDIAFLAQLADKEGATVKVASKTIVVYDDRKFEQVAPVRTLERGKANIKSYDFSCSLMGAAYTSCEVTYYDTYKKQTISGSFTVPEADKSGPTLKLHERVESTADAVRYARNELRRRNREAQRARFVLLGDPGIVQGVTVAVKGYGEFDAVYFVETATHSVGSGGYETTIELRKVLSY